MVEIPTSICFFKKKTAYEISTRDWSSDVCSSDLGTDAGHQVEIIRAPSRQPILRATRSEEHTSELQSRADTSYAVFCLKKNKDNRRLDQDRQWQRTDASQTRTAAP